MPDQQANLLGTTLVRWRNVHLGHYGLGTYAFSLPECKEPYEIPAVVLCDLSVQRDLHRWLVRSGQGVELLAEYLVEHIIHQLCMLNGTVIGIRLLLVKAHRTVYGFWRRLGFQPLASSADRNAAFKWLYFDLAGLDKTGLAYDAPAWTCWYVKPAQEERIMPSRIAPTPILNDEESRLFRESLGISVTVDQDAGSRLSGSIFDSKNSGATDRDEDQ